MATATTARTIGSSYAISWAAARNPPMSEYLFPDDHPAMRTPSVLNDETAST
jgi:hypothetical protein